MRAYVACSTLVVCILNATYARAGGDEVPATDIDREIEAERQRFDKEWGSAGTDAPPYDIQSVLSLLKLDHPGMEATRTAAERGDWPEAEKELLRYFKTTRTYDAASVKKLSEPDRALAEAALRHRFPGNKAFPPTFRGVRIDWRSEAVIDGKTIKDAEWLFQYHRLNWWPALAKAYAATGDERYAREWRYELVAYARENLPFTRQTPGFIRRGMETYGRCQQHAFTLPYMLKSAVFDASPSYAVVRAVLLIPKDLHERKGPSLHYIWAI